MIAQNATVTTDADAVLARIVQVHCTKDHFTREGEQKALRLNRMKVEDLSGLIGAALANEKKLILLHFVKKQSQHSRNPCAVKLQSGINGSATPAVLWTDFIPFAA